MAASGAKRTGRLVPALIVMGCLVGLAALAGFFVVPGADHHAKGTGAATGPGGVPVITVGGRDCAAGVGPVRSGQIGYRVRNVGVSMQEVIILDRAHRYAYGELELIAPGTTRNLVAILPAGRFTLACEANTGTVGYSDPITVSGGPVTGVHRWIPVTYLDLAKVVTRYRASVTTGLRRLSTDTDALLVAVRDHDRSTAQSRWLTAHLDYQRLGAAYDTFGDYADAIDGRPDGLPGGVRDPGFSGFHRLEYDLWHAGAEAEASQVAGVLDRDVHRLVDAFPHQVTPPNDVALRSHEILENTLQFELTGDTDEGSHSNLATMSANIDGTRMTLGALAPLLEQNDPVLLTGARAALDRLDRLLLGLRRPDGSWPALTSLTDRQRQELNGTLAGTLEKLAPIPTELEVLFIHDNN
jgi:iron uptake system EfeUOB component EfeO/EfeM